MSADCEVCGRYFGHLGLAHVNIKGREDRLDICESCCARIAAAWAGGLRWAGLTTLEMVPDADDVDDGGDLV